MEGSSEFRVRRARVSAFLVQVLVGPTVDDINPALPVVRNRP